MRPEAMDGHKHTQLAPNNCPVRYEIGSCMSRKRGWSAMSAKTLSVFVSKREGERERR